MLGTPMRSPARPRHSSPASRRNLRVALVFLSPWLIGMLGLWLIPTVLSLYFAFTDYTGAIWPPHWIGLTNFADMVNGSRSRYCQRPSA